MNIGAALRNITKVDITPGFNLSRGTSGATPQIAASRTINPPGLGLHVSGVYATRSGGSSKIAEHDYIRR